MSNICCVWLNQPLASFLPRLHAVGLSPRLAINKNLITVVVLRSLRVKINDPSFLILLQMLKLFAQMQFEIQLVLVGQSELLGNKLFHHRRRQNSNRIGVFWLACMNMWVRVWPYFLLCRLTHKARCAREQKRWADSTFARPERSNKRTIQEDDGCSPVQPVVGIWQNEPQRRPGCTSTKPPFFSRK